MSSQKQKDSAANARAQLEEKRRIQKQRKLARSKRIRGKNNPQYHKCIITHTINNIEIPDYLERKFDDDCGYRS